MKAKAYLEQIKESREKIRQLENQLESVKVAMTEIKSIDLERIHAPGAENDGIIGEIVKLNRIAEDAIKQKVRHETTKDRIIKEIQTLPNVKQVELLNKRYIEYKSLETISVEMGFSYDDIRREHGRALAEFERLVLEKPKKSKDDTQ